jgi:hypothetical protein
MSLEKLSIEHVAAGRCSALKTVLAAYAGVTPVSRPLVCATPLTRNWPPVTVPFETDRSSYWYPTLSRSEIVTSYHSPGVCICLCYWAAQVFTVGTPSTGTSPNYSLTGAAIWFSPVRL